jgi:hypothetical protein
VLESSRLAALGGRSGTVAQELQELGLLAKGGGGNLGRLGSV